MNMAWHKAFMVVNLRNFTEHPIWVSHKEPWFVAQEGETDTMVSPYFWTNLKAEPSLPFGDDNRVSVGARFIRGAIGEEAEERTEVEHPTLHEYIDGYLALQWKGEVKNEN
jgi:hypothetical protein